MAVESVRKHFRQASEEIESACESTTGADTEEYLTGIVSMLDYYVEGDIADPEAHAYPQPGALDTIQRRLTEIIDESDDATAEYLKNARTHLLAAIMMLDRRLNEGKTPTRGR